LFESLQVETDQVQTSWTNARRSPQWVQTTAFSAAMQYENLLRRINPRAAIAPSKKSTVPLWGSHLPFATGQAKVRFPTLSICQSASRFHPKPLPLKVAARPEMAANSALRRQAIAV
jgi:hypothetical protein